MPIGTSKVGALGGLVPGGTITFNTSGNWTVPPGVKKVSVTGAGGTGNPGNPGNTGNPGNPGNPGNAGNPGSGGSGGGGYTMPGMGALRVNYTGGPISDIQNNNTNALLVGGAAGNGINPGIGNLSQQNFNAAGAGPVGQSGSAGNTGSAGNVGQAGTAGNAGNTGQTSSVFGQNYTGGAGGNAGNAGAAGAAGNAGAAGQAGTGGPGGSAGGLSSPVGPGGSNGSGGAGGTGGGSGGAGGNGFPAPPVFSPNYRYVIGGMGGGGAGTSGNGSTGQNASVPTDELRRSPGGVGGTTFTYNTPPGPVPVIVAVGYGGLGRRTPFASNFIGPAPYWPTFVGALVPNVCVSNQNTNLLRNLCAPIFLSSNSNNVGSIPSDLFNQPNTRPLIYRGGGGGGAGERQGAYGINPPFPTQVSYGHGGGGGGGRGNAANAGGAGGAGGTAPAGGAGNPGQAATPATNNCVPVVPGSTYPVTIGTGGTITISWNPQ